MVEKNDRFDEIHSEDLNAIIEKPPSWLMKWGTALILFLIFLILLMTAYVRYPEELEGTIKFMPIQSAPEIIDPTGEIVKRRLIENKEEVNANKGLAFIKKKDYKLYTIKILDSLKYFKKEIIEGKSDPTFPYPHRQISSEIVRKFHKILISYLRSVAS